MKVNPSPREASPKGIRRGAGVRSTVVKVILERVLEGGDFLLRMGNSDIRKIMYVIRIKTVIYNSIKV